MTVPIPRPAAAGDAHRPLEASAARARMRLLTRARAVRDGDLGVPSPCVSVCRMDAVTRWCEGCLRDIDEIAGWAGMDDAARVVVWHRIEHRVRALQQASSPTQSAARDTP
jgi:uncharacterized protein